MNREFIASFELSLTGLLFTKIGLLSIKKTVGYFCGRFFYKLQSIRPCCRRAISSTEGNRKRRICKLKIRKTSDT